MSLFRRILVVVVEAVLNIVLQKPLAGQPLYVQAAKQ
jgi:uncharacterized membrane protein